MGHGAWGMGHGAMGMGHGKNHIYSGITISQAFLIPIAHCPIPQLPLPNPPITND
jgi:hypothetical protein